MKKRLLLVLAALSSAWLLSGGLRATEPVDKGEAADQKVLHRWFSDPDPIAFDKHDGYHSLFDGVSLKGWDGNPNLWRVEDGAIVGESTKEKPVGNAYLVYRAEQPYDFDLKLELKVTNGGGSGIQYRSKTGIPWRGRIPTGPGYPAINLNWMMTGPQADFWFPVSPMTENFSGQFYTENSPLGIVAWRGQVVNLVAGARPRLVANIADRAPLGGYVRTNDWNEYLIMVRGGTFIHVINGQLMAVLVDDDPHSVNNQTGYIGVELESFPCKVWVRNIWLKTLR